MYLTVAWPKYFKLFITILYLAILDTQLITVTDQSFVKVLALSCLRHVPVTVLHWPSKTISFMHWFFIIKVKHSCVLHKLAAHADFSQKEVRISNQCDFEHSGSISLKFRAHVLNMFSLCSWIWTETVSQTKVSWTLGIHVMAWHQGVIRQTHFKA